jgi:predicted TIM-barrel fold metal-dependent hydrolase
MDLTDTHCHIISPDQSKYPRAPLGGKQSGWASSRPVTAENLVAAMDKAGVGQAVIVQASTAYGYDNSYVLDSCARWPRRFVAVGTFDPLEADAPVRLEAAVRHGGLAGVRLFTTGSTMTGQGEWFAASETFGFWRAAGELAVTVCLQMRLGAATAQLRSVLEKFPSVTVFLDHMGYPDIAASPSAAGRQVAELARYPGLHLKLTHRSLEPLRDAGKEAVAFLDPVVQAFGAERIAWGSNFPAAEQPLAELVDLATNVLEVLPESARAQIFAGTARHLYPSLGKEAVV